MTDDQFPSLIGRVIRIVEYARQRIGEYRQRLVERDAVILSEAARLDVAALQVEFPHR
ncbi:MAG TPA: hypothetical protein VIX63_06860 [Vicinamibacterales bacterium]